MSVVVSWNVAGRVRGVADQARALAEQRADVIALQEVRMNSREPWRAVLREMGFEHVVTSLDDRDPLLRMHPDRRLGVLLASRTPIELRDGPELPWPERLLVARLELGGRQVELYNLHAPLSSKPDQVKVRTLEALTDRLASPSRLPRILVGDLNTPQYESREGEVSSFARTRTGHIREQYGERHDAAELGIIIGLTQRGYVDAFRSLHGYSRRDRSWLYPNGKMGYRLDHVLVRGLEVAACDYRHDWRERGLSDHAGVWALFESS